MGSLYLNLCSKHPCKEKDCPLETLIILCLYKHCAVSSNVSIIFVESEKSETNVPISLEEFNYTVVKTNDLTWQVKSCKFPAFVSAQNVVTGLCGVARHLVKYRTSKPFVGEHPEGLLGFRSGCLQAPNGVSVWTKFCELEIIQCTTFLLNHDFNKPMTDLPDAIAKFENHLNQPLRLANIYKIAREIKDASTNKISNASLEISGNNNDKTSDEKGNVSGDELKLYSDVGNCTKVYRDKTKQRKWKSRSKEENSSTTPQELLHYVQHSFSEGPFLTLADIILYPCYSIIFKMLNNGCVVDIIPKSSQWFKMFEDESFKPILDVLSYTLHNLNEYNQNGNVLYILPEIENVSLYKCDPKRHNPKKREFTKDSDINHALSLVSQNENIIMNVQENRYIEKKTIRWSDIPSEANPYGGYLPDKRKERKTQQLENLVQCIMSLAKDGQKIADFCCGSGHLGILLAYLLPKCTVILVENKEESLNRASERIKKLSLKNIYVFQCNIDYYIGEFDIGVALHACGTATDLVLDKCITKRASFVVSPCCYGSLSSAERLKYPRSKLYSILPLDKYLCIGHAADQTHSNHPLEAQGVLSMTIIDSDRLTNALENDYKVYLTRMQPLSCTPKNMLLVGEPTM